MDSPTCRVIDFGVAESRYAYSELLTLALSQKAREPKIWLPSLCGRKVGDESKSSLNSATPRFQIPSPTLIDNHLLV